MTDAPFRPFESHLDEAAALARLREATAGAEDGELFLERRRGESLVLFATPAMMPPKVSACARSKAMWRAMPIPPKSPNPH